MRSPQSWRARRIFPRRRPPAATARAADRARLPSRAGRAQTRLAKAAHGVSPVNGSRPAARSRATQHRREPTSRRHRRRPRFPGAVARVLRTVWAQRTGDARACSGTCQPVGSRSMCRSAISRRCWARSPVRRSTSSRRTPRWSVALPAGSPGLSAALDDLVDQRVGALTASGWRVVERSTRRAELVCADRWIGCQPSGFACTEPTSGWAPPVAG